jgi:hypothetical protein
MNGLRGGKISFYLGIKKRAQLELRWMCRIFRDALPCLPLWTSFPHPIYPTLKGLADRLNHLGNDYVDLKASDMSIGLKVYLDHGPCYKDHTITKINPDGTYNITGLPFIYTQNIPLAKLKQKVIHSLPSLLFIENGIHVIEIYQRYGSDSNRVNINIPISIVGESREHCIVIGGLQMGGKPEDDVNVSNLTLRESKGIGVWGRNGASMHLDNVSVENSEGCCINVFRTKRNSMKNCNVSHSKLSGLLVHHGGVMMIDGNGTTIHHNCTCGLSGDYGLHASSSSSIHLVSPLTIEMISKNNDGGGNHGGPGTIAIVDNEGTFIETVQEAAEDNSEDEDY